MDFTSAGSFFLMIQGKARGTQVQIKATAPPLPYKKLGTISDVRLANIRCRNQSVSIRSCTARSRRDQQECWEHWMLAGPNRQLGEHIKVMPIMSHVAQL